ncbi:hypothetical protein KC19_3G256900 [Ceratodon purpureus]|uniref:Protein kinase domain-containing protein n=1 Tax=Ceratodon purpureus TaxID=3225 RepID=A0A8T0IQH7_CERPU|nr:hypothetical protein KC19_3G256900 [Ceratodon purpureus]
MAQFVSKMSGLFSSKPIGDAEATQLYLELTTKVMVRVEKLTSPNRSTSPKVYFEQCKYLVEKLQMAVKSADSFLALLNGGSLRFPSPEETSNCLEIFKLLYALAKEVENFIQTCCKDAWIQAAVTLTNVSEHISSIGFSLMLWTVIFCEITQSKARRRFTQTQVDGIFKAEVERVKEKASLDKEAMLRNLHAVLRIRKSSSKEYSLAILLLERLDRSRKVPVDGSPGSSQSRLSETVSSSLKRMESLGKGSAATVYRAKWLEAEVAQKMFYPEKIPDFEKEVSILGGLSHSNIASLFCFAKDEHECSIVMELMDEDLMSLTRRRRSNKTRKFPFEILEAVDIMHQVGEGMKYLHGMKIVHRDLKPLNILVKCVKSSEPEIEYVLAKVADFGLSSMKENSVTYSNQTLNTGTTRWMAPEVIKSCSADSQAEKSKGETIEAQYPFKRDIYSFAMVCYEILTGYTPFSSLSNPEVKKLVLDGGRPPLPSECPLLLRNLIERCWSPEARNRPRFDEICAELCYLKYLFLSPSVLRNVSPASNKPSSIPIGFKREAHSDWFQWTVGLDIGTTHSGFSFAKGSHLQQMHVNYDYPYAESTKPYCKTLTALYYNQAVPSKPENGPGTILNCDSWGHHAQLTYLANVHKRRPGYNVPNFKLLLPKALNNHPLETFPPPLTVNFILADYLKNIGELALASIKNQENEGNFDKDSVQWCVTVPSTWDEAAKQRMKECMVKAGLVSRDGGIESVRVVLKAEAASFHCYGPLQLFLSLDVKDKIMVVDIGGWTVDIVVQEVVGSGNDFKVKEITESSSALCGGTFVNDSYMSYLLKMVGCLGSFLTWDDPSYRSILMNLCEEIKCDFGHEVNSSPESYVITLPETLARKWDAHEKKIGYPGRLSYDKITLTQKDLESIFDPVVDDILRLIASQLVRVQDIKVMFVVGGFASSPYLIQSIRGCFSREVPHIYCPYDPGSAIMQGAVALALTPEVL